MAHYTYLAAVVVAAAGVLATAADASVGFQLRITPYRGTGVNAQNLGFPYHDLTNTADAASIVDYKITIGDADYFWDLSRVNASSQIPDADANNVTPGTAINNQGDEVIHYTFAAGIFLPGRVFSHRADIDHISEWGQEEDYTVNQPDFRQVLFQLNGSDDSDNALVTVVFSNGRTLAARVPDFEGPTSNDFYTFNVTGPGFLPGDANGDGRVDGEDFLVWQAAFGAQAGATWFDGDFNGDRRVDGEDFLIWQANFGSADPVPAMTPEPAALSAVGAMALLMLRRTRYNCIGYNCIGQTSRRS